MNCCGRWLPSLVSQTTVSRVLSSLSIFQGENYTGGICNSRLFHQLCVEELYCVILPSTNSTCVLFMLMYILLQATLEESEIERKKQKSQLDFQDLQKWKISVMKARAKKQEAKACAEVEDLEIMMVSREVPPNQDPMMWMKENQKAFPVLSKFWLAHSSFPATM